MAPHHDHHEWRVFMLRATVPHGRTKNTPSCLNKSGWQQCCCYSSCRTSCGWIIICSYTLLSLFEFLLPQMISWGGNSRAELCQLPIKAKQSGPVCIIWLGLHRVNLLTDPWHRFSDFNVDPGKKSKLIWALLHVSSFSFILACTHLYLHSGKNIQLNYLLLEPKLLLATTTFLFCE